MSSPVTINSSVDSTDMSESKDWSKLTMAQLKEELDQRGLDTHGKKAALISRLEMLSVSPDLTPKDEPDTSTVEADLDKILDEEGDEAMEDSAVAESNTEQEVTEGEKPVAEMEQEEEVQEEEDGQQGEQEEEQEENGEEIKKEEETTADDDEEEAEEKGDFKAAAVKYADSPYYTPFFKYFPVRGDKNHCQVHPLKKDAILEELKTGATQRRVNLYPLEITDLSRSEILSEIEKCGHFSMNYYRDDNDQWAGRLELEYKDQEDCEGAKERLQFDEDIVVRGLLSPEETKESDDAIHKKPAETINPERLLYVAPMTTETTLQDLKEAFNDADDILLFKDKPKPPRPGFENKPKPPPVAEGENPPIIERKKRLPLCHAYLVYADKAAARAAALKYIDPEEDLIFHNKVSSVVPALETEGDLLFHVLHRGRRKHLVRGIALSQCWLHENRFATPKDKRSRYKHSRYHYNCLKRDEDARKALGLTMLEPSVETLVPNIKLLWTERKPGEVAKPKEPGSFRGNFRGRGRGGFVPNRGRGGQAFRSPGNDSYTNRGSYAGGSYNKRGGSFGGGARGANTYSSGYTARGSYSGSGGGYSSAGRGYQREEFTSPRSSGYGGGYGASASSSYVSQGEGWGGGYGSKPPSSMRKKEALLDKLSSLLDLGDEDDGYGDSYQQGYKRPGPHGTPGAMYKRPRGGAGGGMGGAGYSGYY